MIIASQPVMASAASAEIRNLQLDSINLSLFGYQNFVVNGLGFLAPSCELCTRPQQELLKKC